MLGKFYRPFVFISLFGCEGLKLIPQKGIKLTEVARKLVNES